LTVDGTPEFTAGNATGIDYAESGAAGERR
jgi:hypothetical protein